LLSELTLLYTAFAQGRPSPLRPLPIQFTDFAWWQRRIFGGEPLADQIGWWRETLARRPPPPTLPIDLPRPEVVGTRAVHASVTLSPETAQPLRVFARRTSPELWDQIGLFMNTLALRVDLSGNPSFRKLVERISEAALEAYLHQEVPFARVLQELFPGRPLTRTLFSGVCFNMLTFAETADAPAGGAEPLPDGLTLSPLPGEEGGTKHDLVFTCAERDGAVLFDLTGAADLFTPERIRTIARDFETLLARVTADPDIRLSRLREMVRPPAR